MSTVRDSYSIPFSRALQSPPDDLRKSGPLSPSGYTKPGRHADFRITAAGHGEHAFPSSFESQSITLRKNGCPSDRVKLEPRRTRSSGADVRD
jgi:hypothetical protein